MSSQLETRHDKLFEELEASQGKYQQRKHLAMKLERQTLGLLNVSMIS